MNKYQEALQRLATDYISQYGNPASELRVLQELIDNYEKLVQENKAYKYLFKEDSADKNNANIEKVSVYYENKRLEKALDKACDYLVKLSNKVPYLYLPVETTKDWKEWLLKDE